MKAFQEKEQDDATKRNVEMERERREQEEKHIKGAKSTASRFVK